MNHMRPTSEILRHRCDEKLLQLFHGNIPASIMQRVEAELSFIENNPAIHESLQILLQLAQTAEKNRQYLSLQGAQASSYIFWLLGITKINPLPSHYYCPQCGSFEEAGDRRGDCSCLKCGTLMIAGGYDLPVESFTGLRFDNVLIPNCRITSAFLPFAKQILTALYPQRQVAASGRLHSEKYGLSLVKPCGFVILPEGCSLEDYPELRGVLEDGSPCLVMDFAEEPELLDAQTPDGRSRMGWKEVILQPDPLADMVLALQQKTSILMEEIPQAQLRQIRWQQISALACFSEKERYLLAATEPAGFRERISIHAQCSSVLVHESGEDKTDDLLAHLEVHTIAKSDKWPGFTREDYFHTMIACGMNRMAAYRAITDMEVHGTQSSPYCLFLPSLRDVAEDALLQTYLAWYALRDGQAYSQIAAVYRTK